jgi:Flp pilus assembly protein TadB
VYLFVWQPDYINSFLESRMGQSVFAVAIALQVIGIVWVLSLTKPEA